jgi:hypothetical protein
MKTTIDKISIEDMMQGEELCPDCQEEAITDLMNQLVLEDDIEEAVEYARGISKQCKKCYNEN